MIAGIDLGRLLSRYAIHSRWIFFPIAGALLAYLLYTMIRKPRGERPGATTREPEL